MITLYEDEVLKIVMPEDFLKHPERYEVGKGVLHIYKGVGKMDEQNYRSREGTPPAYS